MTLPIDRTTLTAAAVNQVPNAIIRSAQNIAAITAAFNGVDEVYNFATGLISTGTLSRLGIINVKDYNASGLATTAIGSITTGTKVLTLTTTPDFVAGHGINLQGAIEASSLQVTAAATVSSNVTVTLNGVAFLVAVLNGDTAIQVATKIRAATYTGWTAGGTAGTDTVTFTSLTTGNKTDATYSAGTTTATGTMTTTTQGTADQISTVSSVSGLVVTIADNATRTVSAGTIFHDDWTAITAAFTAAAALTYAVKVVLPSGRYYITQPLVLPINVVLVGQSRSSTSINLVNNIGGSVISAIATSQGRVEIRDISLAGHTLSGNGIYIQHARGLSILENILISNCGNSGIKFITDLADPTDGSYGAVIEKCYISNCLGYGIELSQNSNSSVIRDCQLWTNGNGILATSSYGVVIEKNIIESNTTFGILMQDCWGSDIINNYIEDNAGQVFITNNDVVKYSDKVRVEGNFFEGGSVSGYAVKVDFAKHVTIRDNFTRNHTGNPFIVNSNATETLIEYNKNREATDVTDSGSGTIIKRLVSGGETTVGNRLLNGVTDLGTLGILKLGTYFPGSPSVGMIAYNASTKNATMYDGTAYRRAFYPSGVKAIVASNTTAAIGSGDGFPTEPDASYGVKLTPNQNVVCWASGLLTTGFTINIAANGAGTITYPVNVTWEISR